MRAPISPMKQHCELCLAACLLLAITGCASDDEYSAGIAPPGTSQTDPAMAAQDASKPRSNCQGLTLTEPLDGAFVLGKVLTVKGRVSSSGETHVMVEGQPVSLLNGHFETELQKQDGLHTLEVSCDDAVITRAVTVSAHEPKVVMSYPASGALIDLGPAPLQVRGHVENLLGFSALQINGQRVQVDATGHFQLDYEPKPGLNHIDAQVDSKSGQTLDMRRSFLVGTFTRWDDQSSATVVAQVGTTAFNQVSQLVADRLEPQTLRTLLAPHMRDDGELELHEFRYDKPSVLLEPKDGALDVRVRLDNFGVKLSYRYDLLGVGGHITGWATCSALEIVTTARFEKFNENYYDLRFSEPRVTLEDFELQLDDIYQAVEGLVRERLLAMGEEAMSEALSEVVSEALFPVDVLQQELTLFGRTTEMQISVDELRVTPAGINGVGFAQLEPFEVVKSARGFYSSNPITISEGGSGDVSLGMSVDFFNRLLGESWRAGLLDTDLDALFGAEQAMTSAIFSGVISRDLREHLDLASTVQVETRALMQPIARVADPVTGQLTISAGAIEIDLASANDAGELVHWATIEVSAELDVQPKFVEGTFSMEAEMKSHIELVAAPLVDIEEQPFEEFLETLVNRVSGKSLEKMLHKVIRFGDVNVYGLGVGHIDFGSPYAEPGFLRLGVELTDLQR